jgi:hypothetical protein
MGGLGIDRLHLARLMTDREARERARRQLCQVW